MAITEFPYDIPEIADYKANYARNMLNLGSDALASLFKDQLNSNINLEVLATSMMGMVAMHFYYETNPGKAGR